MYLFIEPHIIKYIVLVIIIITTNLRRGCRPLSWHQGHHHHHQSEGEGAGHYLGILMRAGTLYLGKGGRICRTIDRVVVIIAMRMMMKMMMVVMSTMMMVFMMMTKLNKQRCNAAV